MPAARHGVGHQRDAVVADPLAHLAVQRGVQVDAVADQLDGHPLVLDQREDRAPARGDGSGASR